MCTQNQMGGKLSLIVYHVRSEITKTKSNWNRKQMRNQKYSQLMQYGELHTSCLVDRICLKKMGFKPRVKAGVMDGENGIGRS